MRAIVPSPHSTGKQTPPKPAATSSRSRSEPQSESDRSTRSTVLAAWLTLASNPIASIFGETHFILSPANSSDLLNDLAVLPPVLMALGGEDAIAENFSSDSRCEPLVP
jgi:hypothetical protein